MSSFNFNTWGDERAKDDDRRWFIGNRGRRFRIRDLMPFEIDGPVERGFGIPRRVIIAQIVPGVRIRVLVCIVLFGDDGHVVDYDDNDEALKDAFEQNATPARMAEYRAACAKFGRS